MTSKSAQTFRSCASLLLLLAGIRLIPWLSAQDSLSTKVPPKPAARIELSALGYREPSRLDRLNEDEASLSLQFVDANHVLLVFNRKGILQRLRDCPPDHDDRMMHAVVLELPGGKVVKEADWYLHDRRRFLWQLGPGKLLLRKGNELYSVDSTLHETRLMSSSRNLLSVSVTPDATQIVVVTAAPDASKATKPTSASPTPTGFVAQFLDATTLEPQRSVPLTEPVHLTAISAGYSDLVHKGDVWMLRFGAGAGKRRNLVRVRSHVVPDVLYSSNNSFLIGRCPTVNCDYSVTAFSLTGHRLWQQHWPRYRFFPAISHSADNSRFAVSSLQLAPYSTEKTNNDPKNELGALLPDAAEVDVFQQTVQVFDTATGDVALSVPVSPAVIGENFAFSLDGRHLAVLEGSAMEWFDVPAESEHEQAQFATLKADVPDLNTLGLAAESATSPTDTATGNTSVDSTAATATEPSAATSDSSSGAAATAPNAPPAEPLATIRISTKAVVVDVVVTDNKGRPIKGLHQQDFQLAEDGKAQDMRSFREIRGPDDPTAAELNPVPAGPPKSIAPSPNVFSTSRRMPDPGSVTMILFDMLNTPSQDQVYARQQLIKFLQAKPKNMQFALCTMSVGSRLRLVQGFTPDENLLVAAAKNKRISPKEVRWNTSTQGTEGAVSAVGPLAGDPTSGFQGLLSALQQTEVQEQVADTNERAGITMDSMMLLASYLAGIPGRKNVVWLSGSFPLSLLASTNSGNPAVDNPNYASKVRHVTNLLAEAQIAVYPVDVRGLTINGVGADSAGGMGGPPNLSPQDFSAGSVIAPAVVIPQDMQAFGQRASERDTLLEFAHATGGKAFYNSNGIRDAIATAAEQGSNYYTLSYTPANKLYDGKFRRIKVQLAEKGYTLHYRQGYYADDLNSIARDTQLARKARAVAMQYGSPPSRQLQFSAMVAPIGSKKKINRAKLGDVLTSTQKTPTLPDQVEAQHYIIDYTLEGSELRFIPQQNSTFRNSLTLMVASFGRDGRMLSGTSSIGINDLQPAAYEKVVAGEFGVQQEVDVPVDATSLRIGIQDQMSNHIGTVDVDLPVPAIPNLARHTKSPLPEIEPD